MSESVIEYELWLESKVNVGDSLATISATALGNVRSVINQVGVLRARRLSDEALSLPPTHYLILGILSVLTLAGFLLVSLGSVTVDVDGISSPSLESNILFAVLTGVYTLFFNFSRDLNAPFEGVYQIRRSQVACSLLKARNLILKSGHTEVTFGWNDEGERTHS